MRLAVGMHAWRLLGFGGLVCCAGAAYCLCFFLCMGVCLFAVGGFVLGVFFAVH